MSTTEEQILEAARRVIADGGPLYEPGDTVEYVDDDPKSGTVVFKRKGQPYAWMPIEDYEAILAKKSEAAK